MEDLLELINISKKYGKQQVLDRIFFSIAPGEIVGFLGPNGAGKSTTMKIIAGCVGADNGTVLVKNVEMTCEAIEPKRQIGYLPENNPLYDELYVSEYLEYVCRLYEKPAKEIIPEIIKKTGLLPESHKKIGQLSKGYRQRVGIAQALIPDPELLILDEPTSGLDPNQINETTALLQEISRHKAILFSSHTLSEVTSICTRIILIHQGKIRADKPLSEIEDINLFFKQLTDENSSR